MAKRFTDTDKWRDPWFQDLSNTERLFWVYLLDNCNHAGIWQANWPLVKFYFGSRLGMNLEKFGGRARVISPQKWFIPRFIEFQYGELNPDNRAHQSVVSILKKEGVWEDYVRGLYAPKDKDKETDKDKEQGVVGGDEESPPERAPRKKSDYQLLIEHFAANREIKLENDAQARRFFGMHGEAAKSILDQAGGDLEMAKLAVTEIAAYADSEVRAGRWDPWKNLAALEKRFVEWKSEYNKDVNGERNVHKKA